MATAVTAATGLGGGWGDATVETGPELVCTSAACGLAYRIDDGVPVLLVVGARRPA